MDKGEKILYALIIAAGIIGAIFYSMAFIRAGNLFMCGNTTCEKQKETTPKSPTVESIKIGDKNTKVIIDDTTGCKYIVFNNKTLTPLYDKSGKVEGCGE